MDKDLIKEIESHFKGTDVSLHEENRLIIKISENNLLEILKFLKDNEFNYLLAVSCVDWIDEKEFELVYHLSSIKTALHIMVKIRIPRKNPIFTTIIPIFKNAQAYEREIHELFGVYFEGNPRLIPLFLEDWKGIPPFRKDFDTREYVKETFDNIPTLEEYKNE